MTRKKVATRKSVAEAIRDAVTSELQGRNFAETLWWEPEAAIAEAITRRQLRILRKQLRARDDDMKAWKKSE